MAGRYYCIQLTDSRKSTVFAYIGKRITETDSSVLVIGRVLVDSHSDLSTAYELTKQIHYLH